MIYSLVNQDWDWAITGAEQISAMAGQPLSRGNGCHWL